MMLASHYQLVRKTRLGRNRLTLKINLNTYSYIAGVAQLSESTFSTIRTSIEQLTLNDCAFILKLVNSPGWIKFIGDRNIHSEEDARFYIQRILDNPDIIYWVVRLKENQNPIGIVTFIEREYLDFHDIGFAFLPEFNNKGYALESTESVLTALLSKNDYPVILATTIPQNVSSVKLLTKLRFAFEKEISINNETLHVYRISKNELSEV